MRYPGSHSLLSLIGLKKLEIPVGGHATACHMPRVNCLSRADRSEIDETARGQAQGTRYLLRCIGAHGCYVLLHTPIFFYR